MKNQFPIEKYLKQWLAENDFDGFFCRHDDCACDTSDLVPCCVIENVTSGNCRGGYRVDRPCYNSSGELCEWGIFEERPEDK